MVQHQNETPHQHQGEEQQQQQQKTSMTSRATATSTARRVLYGRWRKKMLFGNRFKLAVTGGSHTSPDVMAFLFHALGVAVVNGYGTTETGGLSGNNGTQGGDLQLIDCPELNYLTLDQPWPRGEVVAHTARMTPGYFGDDEKTHESFVTIRGKRFFRTGDVGELIKGHLHIIDRKKDVFKLAQVRSDVAFDLDRLMLVLHTGHVCIASQARSSVCTESMDTPGHFDFSCMSWCAAILNLIGVYVW